MINKFPAILLVFGILSASPNQSYAGGLKWLRCETLGVGFMSAMVELQRDQWNTDSDSGYDLQVKTHPINSESTQVEVLITTGSSQVFSTSETVVLANKPHGLFQEFAGDLWISCEVK